MDEMHDVAERRRTAEEWEKHIQEQPASGRRVNAYCREQGLATHKFYYWRARLRGRGQEPRRKTRGHTILTGQRNVLGLRL
jgi:hypothetical protein